MAKRIISLTAIPPRFLDIGATLETLLAQKVHIDEIRLYIPEKYRRFKDYDGSLPKVPEGVSICVTKDDFGPATKILPAIRDLRGEDCTILFCDDDRIYEPNWAGRLLTSMKNALIIVLR